MNVTTGDVTDEVVGLGSYVGLVGLYIFLETARLVAGQRQKSFLYRVFRRVVFRKLHVGQIFGCADVNALVVERVVLFFRPGGMLSHDRQRVPGFVGPGAIRAASIATRAVTQLADPCIRIVGGQLYSVVR